MQRVAIPLAILVAALAATWWLWAHAPQPTPAAAPVISTPSIALPTPTGLEALSDTTRRYRLAGTAVGEPNSFAAVEMPDGTSSLYRVGAEIPGLGQLLQIHGDHIVVDTPDGEATLQLKPAATPTVDRRRLGRAPKRTVTSAPQDPSEDIPDESDREDDPDLPAS